MKHLTTWGLIGVALVSVAAVVGLVLALSAPPIEYSQEVYQPERSQLCPDETLVYTNTLTVSRPALIPFTYSYWSVERGRFAIPADALQYRPFARGASITVRRENKLPDLPAGEYELWFVAGETGRAAASHRVPFTVRAGC